MFGPFLILLNTTMDDTSPMFWDELILTKSAFKQKFKRTQVDDLKK